MAFEAQDKLFFFLFQGPLTFSFISPLSPELCSLPSSPVALWLPSFQHGSMDIYCLLISRRLFSSKDSFRLCPYSSSTPHLTIKSKVGNRQNLTPLRSTCLLGEWHSRNDLDAGISANVLRSLTTSTRECYRLLKFHGLNTELTCCHFWLANYKDLLGWISCFPFRPSFGLLHFALSPKRLAFVGCINWVALPSGSG